MDDLAHLAQLLKVRNAIDQVIAAHIGRPAEWGHIGEYIAAAVFGVVLHKAANYRATDGVFLHGPQAGRSVNVKWYGAQENLLDLALTTPPDTYLVFTGAKRAGGSSRGLTRSLVINFAFLFDAHDLHQALAARGVRLGPATSVAQPFWDAAEIYPQPRNPRLPLTPEQRALLTLFA
jgi:hypothetical protein